jgi:transposase
MKKNSTTPQRPRGLSKGQKTHIRQVAAQQRLTIAFDLGDRSSRYCILDEAGEKVQEGAVATTAAGLRSVLERLPPSRVAVEVGTHSPWVSRQIAALGHEAIVANPRRLKLITQSVKKNDRIDAEQLARLARVDARLLSPIRHRGAEAQADLAVIRARAALVDARTELINSARGLAKPMGERLPRCDADQVREALAEGLGAALQPVLRGLLKSVEEISRQIQRYDQIIEQIAARYPEKELLMQVWGVGVLIALTFLLTIEDAQRFAHSRDVGPYLGLTPKQRDSGESQPELGISKCGDTLLRRLLVQGAHCILREGAPDSDLQAWARARLPQKGKKGGKAARKKAVVAVARKLAVLLHRLWVTGEVYDPRYQRRAVASGQAA